MIPLVDTRISGALATELSHGFDAMLETGQWIGGAAVEQFEQVWAAHCHAKECVGVSSGTDALRLALLAAGLEPGQEVIVPALTFVGTWEAIIQAGGDPVPVDVRERDGTLDASLIDRACSRRTAFVIPVHLYGGLADMRAIASAAPGVPIIEDACQAHGATRDWKSEAAAYSFYPSKNLGALGDAGAIVTDNAALASRIRRLRQHGEVSRYHHEDVGYTARLDAIQAFALSRKLPYLASWNKARAATAETYTEQLAGIGDLVLPNPQEVWHLYVIRTANPDGLALHLAGLGVGSGRHYPVPVPFAPAYACYGYLRGDFPVAELIASRCLSLPLFPGITESQIDQVCDAVRSWFRCVISA